MVFSTKRHEEIDLNLIDNQLNMKKLLALLLIVLSFSACHTLTEKVEVKFPNGQPQIVRYYDKSDVVVKEVEYYESGQVRMEGGMKNGKRDGLWTAYFPDGRPQSIGYFEDGMRTGQATVYQENGNLYEEGFYKKGKHCGKWKFYDEQGDLIKEVDFGELE